MWNKQEIYNEKNKNNSIKEFHRITKRVSKSFNIYGYACMYVYIYIGVYLYTHTYINTYFELKYHI